MAGFPSIQYLNLIGVERDRLRFQEGDRTRSVLEFQEITTTKEPSQEVVTQVDYRDCIGLVRLVVDFFIAFIKRCVGCQTSGDEFPQKNYNLTKSKARFKEIRSRAATEGECGVEHRLLIEQIQKTMRQVYSRFSKKQARKIADQAAKVWGKFRIAMEAAQVEVASARGRGENLDSCFQQGFCRPEVCLIRRDETRNDKLFQSQLEITLPIKERGLERTVTLFAGIVFGAENSTPREVALRAASEEGLALELGNESETQEALIKRALGAKREKCVKPLTHTLELIRTELLPEDDRIVLTTSGKDQVIVVKAKDLALGCLTSDDDERLEEKRRQVEDTASRCCKAPEGWEVVATVVREPHDTRWGVEFTLTPIQASA